VVFYCAALAAANISSVNRSSPTMSTTEMTKPSENEALPDSEPPKFSTLSVHGGEARQKPGDSITDPIFCASTYTFADTRAVIDFIEQEQPREE
jgi:cystathionine gamma-synthase